MAEEPSEHSARQLGWELIESAIPYRGKMFRIREDQLRLPRGKSLVYQYEERSPGVIIVPVTSAGEIILIHQFRYPVGTWCFEVPAGGCHDTGTMSMEEVAAKELREEIGGEAGRMQSLGCFFTAPSFADERCQIFLAWETRLLEQPEREHGEAIETRIVPFIEAFRMARSGEINNAACALALLWAEPHVLRHFRVE